MISITQVKDVIVEEGEGVKVRTGAENQVNGDGTLEHVTAVGIDGSQLQFFQ